MANCEITWRDPLEIKHGTGKSMKILCKRGFSGNIIHNWGIFQQGMCLLDHALWLIYHIISRFSFSHLNLHIFRDFHVDFPYFPRILPSKSPCNRGFSGCLIVEQLDTLLVEGDVPKAITWALAGRRAMESRGPGCRCGIFTDQLTMI
jgi:hypothetical protein